MNSTDRAYSFWGMANEYMTAADVLFSMPASSWRPALYLTCHAMELSLKSILIFRGMSDKEIKAIGHDINLAMNIVGANHFPKECQTTTANLSKIYKEKELEYFFPKNKNFGDFGKIKTSTQIIITIAYSEITKNQNQMPSNIAAADD